MECSKDNNKQYIIPTKKWLKPFKPYIIDEINTTGMLMVAALIYFALQNK